MVGLIAVGKNLLGSNSIASFIMLYSLLGSRGEVKVGSKILYRYFGAENHTMHPPVCISSSALIDAGDSIVRDVSALSSRVVGYVASIR